MQPSITRMPSPRARRKAASTGDRPPSFINFRFTARTPA